MTENSSLNVEVRKIPEIHIAYVRHKGAYDPLDKVLFRKLFQKLLVWAAPLNLFNPPKTKALTIFSSGHPDTTKPENLSVDVAISVDENTRTSNEVGFRALPAGEYAVVSLNDATMEECSRAWNTLFSVWLPESGYQPGEGAYYINHLNDPEQHPQKLYDLEMYLPVKAL